MKKNSNLLLKIIGLFCILALVATVWQVILILNPPESLDKPVITALDPSVNFDLINQVYQNRSLKLGTYK